METRIERVKSALIATQARICAALEKLDDRAGEGGARFAIDRWEREAGGGGGGDTRVLTDGTVFERAGVNFSHVYGPGLPAAATAARPELAGRPFEAMGVSLVVHPRNPHVPTSHLNVRFFTTTGDENPIWWFGGGFDLTPYYPVAEDCIRWHRSARAALDPIDRALYPRFKEWCDRYFFLPHRDEARGIGGIFFDDLGPAPRTTEGDAPPAAVDFETGFAVIGAVADGYLEGYVPIVEARADHAFGERERRWQLIRRGRYVEFNLLHDRGTLFGIQSRGRTESILVSMPPVVAWEYDVHPEPGRPEEALLTTFLPPRDWANEGT